MNEDRMKTWESLFRNALAVLDNAVKAGMPDDWMAKKLQFRAPDFKARDLFDLALVLESESAAIPTLARLIKTRRTSCWNAFGPGMPSSAKTSMPLTFSTSIQATTPV